VHIPASRFQQKNSRTLLKHAEHAFFIGDLYPLAVRNIVLFIGDRERERDRETDR